MKNKHEGIFAIIIIILIGFSFFKTPEVDKNQLVTRQLFQVPYSY